MQSILVENFIGAYLQGSFAVGDYDEHSDVDFIIAIEHDLTDEQVEALQVMHARVYDLDCPWAQHLEGSYLPRELLRRPLQAEKDLWYLDHGAQSLIRSDHCNTLVVRWTVRVYGVCMAGPNPTSLIDPIPVQLLRQEILVDMQDWGGEILADPEMINNRFYQGFAVLSYCRMLHDCYRGRPGSKREGADWAKKSLDPVWRGLIDRAWDCRPDPAVSVRQLADPDDLKKTLSFIKYFIEESEQYSLI